MTPKFINQRTRVISIVMEQGNTIESGNFFKLQVVEVPEGTDPQISWPGQEIIEMEKDFDRDYLQAGFLNAGFTKAEAPTPVEATNKKAGKK